MTTPAYSTVRRRRAAAVAGTRLPWWAVALPAVTFCALLALLVAGGGAGAAQSGEPVLHLLEQLRRSLPG
jgi:hypothetical protein